MILMLPSIDRALAEMEWYSNIVTIRSRYLLSKEYERMWKEAVLVFCVAGAAGAGALPTSSSVGTGGFFLGNEGGRDMKLTTYHLLLSLTCKNRASYI
jgi:hypothetical protein